MEAARGLLIDSGPQSVTLTGGYRYVVCTTNCLSHTTATDFATGTTGGTVSITQVGDGEVGLAPTMNAEFGGAVLPGGWSVAPWAAGGGAPGPAGRRGPGSGHRNPSPRNAA